MKKFTSTSERYEKHNGPVTVLRTLTEDECDIHEVGMMFECRDAAGRVFHAFADELEDE